MLYCLRNRSLHCCIPAQRTLRLRPLRSRHFACILGLEDGFWVDLAGLRAAQEGKKTLALISDSFPNAIKMPQLCKLGFFAKQSVSLGH